MTLQLPTARVKKIVKADRDVKLISPDAIALVGRATVGALRRFFSARAR